jgi:hypothetical protein
MFARQDSFSHFEWTLKQLDHGAETERFLAAVVATIKHRRKILRKGTRLCRAQRGYLLKADDEAGTEIPDAFMPERMRPLRDKASEGRVNQKDKPCLYLAESKDTAMAEVRPWIGAYITLAVFEVVRDCILVDCSQDKVTTLDLLMREQDATDGDRELAVWGEIAKALSTPLTHDDTLEEYWATQCLAERLKAEGFDGVAYQSALGKGRNFALFDLDAACPINGTLFKTEAVEYKFEPTNNTYYIPKHYADWARKSGIDPESKVPHNMGIVAFLPLDDTKSDEINADGVGGPPEDCA